jgi:hypothetical protein
MELGTLKNWSERLVAERPSWSRREFVSQVYFITGAECGMGADFPRAAPPLLLAAAVVPVATPAAMQKVDQGVWSLTHIAVQEQLDGRMVDWMEKVSDEQDDAKPGAR